MVKNKKLLIVALVAVVNALGYGIIIPILYSYSKRFGLNDFQNGLLFSIFSVGQFISTPIIGRMSDKYGRKPLLVISLAGTALSFFMAAFAPTALFLYIARALDGLTAGNIPVASAVISDSTEIKDRAKGFGIIWASFGFGFVFGPAISAFTVKFNPSLPFIIAGIISVISVIITALFLPETNKHLGEVKKGKLFDISKLFEAMTYESVGLILFSSLLYANVFGLYIYAFQPFAVEVLKLSADKIALIFTGIGAVGLITQLFFIAKLTKKYGETHLIHIMFFILSLSFLSIYFIRNILAYVVVVFIIGFGNSFVNPLIQTLLSKETDEKSQGTIMGLNSSYIAIGMTIGPILGGLVATIGVPLPFILCSFISLLCFLLSFKIKARIAKKESAF